MHRSILALAVIGALAAPFALAKEPVEVERKVAADPKGAVHVANVAGSVIVEAWDKPEVMVTGTLGSGVTRLDVTSGPQRTDIRVVLPKTSVKDGDADLQIQVPRGSTLDVSAVSASVEVSKVVGPLRLRTVSGDIGSDVAAADVEVKSVSGNVELRGAGAAANLRASTVSGDFSLTRSAGALDLTTVSGDVRIELNPLRQLRARTTSGDMTVRGSVLKGAEVDLATVSGDLTATLPAADGVTFEAESFSGDITTCFGVKAIEATYGPGSHLNATRGAGGSTVRAKSLSGDIRVCDR